MRNFIRSFRPLSENIHTDLKSITVDADEPFSIAIRTDGLWFNLGKIGELKRQNICNKPTNQKDFRVPLTVMINRKRNSTKMRSMLRRCFADTDHGDND